MSTENPFSLPGKSHEELLQEQGEQMLHESEAITALTGLFEEAKAHHPDMESPEIKIDTHTGTVTRALEWGFQDEFAGAVLSYKTIGVVARPFSREIAVVGQTQSIFHDYNPLVPEQKEAFDQALKNAYRNPALVKQDTNNFS